MGRASSAETASMIIVTGHIVSSGQAHMVKDRLVHTVDLICVVDSGERQPKPQHHLHKQKIVHTA